MNLAKIVKAGSRDKINSDAAEAHPIFADAKQRKDSENLLKVTTVNRLVWFACLTGREVETTKSICHLSLFAVAGSVFIHTFAKRFPATD